MLNLFVGFDPREAVAYHTFCQSVLEKSSIPVAFTPLYLPNLKGQYSEEHKDGSNQFIYSRFLVPHLMGYKGWAIFADGDMVCNADIAELYAMRDDSYAVQVVKHDYKTRFPTKYLGNKNEDYPCKNWSSLMLWNCEHPANRVLTPEYIESCPHGAALHRFLHLTEWEVGALPVSWNWLVEEYPFKNDCKLFHYTIGTPCFRDYIACDNAKYWHEAFKNVCHPL